MWRFFKNKREEWMRKIFRPIPEDFHSFETGKPFDTCIECDRDLNYPRADYIIEKGYQDDEVVYEYALCNDCAQNLSGEMSKDSTKHLKRCLKRPILKATIDGCRICGLPRDELPSYAMVGGCLGDEMIFWNVPILICEPCLETVYEGLSKKTRDIMDDFEERNFPGPPEMELDLPEPSPRRKVVII